jgi:tetratricopeptide (TPR) repeat protein
LRRLTVFLFLCLAFHPVPVPAQSRDLPREIQKIRNVLQAGDTSAARTALERLYIDHPGQDLVFSELKRFYVSIRDYRSALDILDARIRTSPDVRGRVEAAQMRHRLGESERALKIWRDVLDENPEDLTRYSMVAGCMIEERLLEEAILVYLRAREHLKNKSLFAVNLAGLYGSLIRYREAAEEMVLYLLENPKEAPYVERELMRYPDSKRVLKDVAGVLEKALAVHSENRGLLGLLCKVYLKAGRYDEALQTAGMLSAMDHSDGQVLFDFAETAFRLGAVQAAGKAYEEILVRYPKYKKTDAVLFGLARTRRNQKQWKDAEGLLDRIAMDFPGSPLAPAALYAKGMVQRDTLKNLDASETTFRQLVERYPKSREGRQSRLEAAVCRMMKGDQGRAEKEFSDLLELHGNEKGDLWIKAVFGLAELMAMQGRFEEALNRLKELDQLKSDREALEQPEFGDALALRIFLDQYGKRYSSTLSRFTSSWFLEKQGKYRQAWIILDSLSSMTEAPPFGDRVLWKKASVEREMGEKDKAVQTFISLPDRFPASIWADQALYQAAGILASGGGKGKAVVVYERLLEKYPHSLYLDRARQNLRTLEE